MDYQLSRTQEEILSHALGLGKKNIDSPNRNLYVSIRGGGDSFQVFELLKRGLLSFKEEGRTDRVCMYSVTEKGKQAIIETLREKNNAR